MPNPGIIAATLIEKSQKIKDKISEIDRQAGTDDALFRRLIKEYFRPELRAEVKIQRRL
jgi:hypothetical protein